MVSGRGGLSEVKEALADPKKRVVGLKQTLRALLQDRVAAIHVADDIDDHIRRKILSAAAERKVTVHGAGLSQQDLGAACRIEVGAAVVAILK
jgi:large subunit ribosomal protein L7A